MSWIINPTITINGASYLGSAVGSVSIDYGRTTVWDSQRVGYSRIQLINTNNTNFPIDINQLGSNYSKKFCQLSQHCCFHRYGCICCQ